MFNQSNFNQLPFNQPQNSDPVPNGLSQDLTLAVVAGQDYYLTLSTEQMPFTHPASYQLHYETSKVAVADPIAQGADNDTVELLSATPGELNYRFTPLVNAGEVFTGVNNVVKLHANATGNTELTLQRVAS
jgi:hypothetical protein